MTLNSEIECPLLRLGVYIVLHFFSSVLHGLGWKLRYAITASLIILRNMSCGFGCNIFSILGAKKINVDHECQTLHRLDCHGHWKFTVIRV